MNAYSRPLHRLFAYAAFTSSVIFPTGNVYGQLYNSPTPFNTYYYDYKLANPAFTGTLDKHVITTVYSGLLYNGGWLTKKFYGSYETKLEAIRSGIGAVVRYNEAVAETHEFTGKNHLQSGVMYSWKRSFNETSGLYLGTQLLYQHLKFERNPDVIIVPGQLPDSASTLVGRRRDIHEVNFDIGTAFYSSKVIIGAALKNIVHTADDQIGINVIVKRIFEISQLLKATPSFLYQTDFNYYNLHFNTAVEFDGWLLVGVDYEVPHFYPDKVTFNIGLNIKDRVQIISHIYSSEAQRFGTSVIETMLRVKIPDKTANAGLID